MGPRRPLRTWARRSYDLHLELWHREVRPRWHHASPHRDARRPDRMFGTSPRPPCALCRLVERRQRRRWRRSQTWDLYLGEEGWASLSWGEARTAAENIVARRLDALHSVLGGATSWALCGLCPTDHGAALDCTCRITAAAGLDPAAVPAAGLSHPAVLGALAPRLESLPPLARECLDHLAPGYPGTVAALAAAALAATAP